MLNETMFHPNQATFRAVTGGAYNFPNSYGNIVRGSAFATKGTIPIAQVREGTFSSTGKVVRGIGTLFTKLTPGQFLYNGDVLRQIDFIDSDIMLHLREAFPSDASGLTVRTCDPQFFKMIVIQNTHASTDAILQEAPFAAGEKIFNGGAPISYDTTSGGELSIGADQ